MEKILLFSNEAIQARVKELAIQISSDYKGRDPVFVGVLNGVVFFFADLLRMLTIPVTMDFIRARSYGSAMESSGKITLTKDVEVQVEGKHIVLVEDIVDTGLTLSHVLDLINKKGAETTTICALVDKLERREVDVPLTYTGFQIEKGFLVGYGLDYNERYRTLPDIYTLIPS